MTCPVRTPDRRVSGKICHCSSVRYDSSFFGHKPDIRCEVIMMSRATILVLRGRSRRLTTSQRLPFTPVSLHFPLLNNVDTDFSMLISRCTTERHDDREEVSTAQHVILFKSFHFAWEHFPIGSPKPGQLAEQHFAFNSQKTVLNISILLGFIENISHIPMGVRMFSLCPYVFLDRVLLGLLLSFLPSPSSLSRAT